MTDQKEMSLVGQFLRFGVVGVMNTALFYLLYLGSIAILQPKYGYYLSYIASLVFAVLVNLKYTFGQSLNSTRVVLFVAVYVVTMFVGGEVLEIIIGHSVEAALAGLFVVGITVILNFVGLKAVAKWA